MTLHRKKAMPALQISSMNWISMFVFLIVYFHFRFLYESDLLISCSIETQWRKSHYWKLNFVGGKCLKLWSLKNFPWGHVGYHKKLGPDLFSYFDVFWIHTNRHPPRQAKCLYVFICIDGLTLEDLAKSFMDLLKEIPPRIQFLQIWNF